MHDEHDDDSLDGAFELEVERCFQSEDWEALDALLLERIASAPNGPALWVLLGTGRLADGLFEEDELAPSVVGAVLDRALGFDAPEDRALSIALATRACVRDPGNLLMRDESAALDYDVKRANLEVLEARAPLLCRWCTDPNASVRAAGYLAVGQLPTAGPELTAVLDRALDDEHDRGALAAALLAAAAQHVKQGTPSRERVRGACDRSLSDEARGLRPVAAACAFALVEGSVDARAERALCAAIEAPEALPASWGLQWHGEQETSDGLAARVLVWAEVASPERVLSALASLADYGWFGEKILTRLGFDHGASIPPCGLAAPELGPLERVAVEALRAPAFSSSFELFHSLGLGVQEDVAPFLAGESPFFRPLSIEGHRWHLGRAWGELTRGALAVSALVPAIDAAMTPSEAVDALTVGRRGVLVRAPGPWTKELAARQAGLLEAWARAHADDAAARAAVAARAASPGDRDPFALALLVVALLGADAAEDVDALLALGYRRRPSDEPLSALLAALPESRRARITGG